MNKGFDSAQTTGRVVIQGHVSSTAPGRSVVTAVINISTKSPASKIENNFFGLRKTVLDEAVAYFFRA